MKALKNRHFVFYRMKMLGSAIALIPLGYFIRFYGPGPAWLNDALGSVMYEMFWITLGLGIWPQMPPLHMAVAVGITTSLLEFLQLWHPPLLQALRQTLLGRLILGTTFHWLDFPAYAGGSILGWWWGRVLLPRRLTFQKPIP
jgi:Protein of unknown function (DUF2809)